MIESGIQGSVLESSDGESLRRGFFLGDWRVHPEDGQLSREDQQVRLRPLQMELLVFLASSPGRVVSKERLFEEVWKGAAVEDGALPRCISELRGALGDNAQAPTFIETIPRRGYRLLAPVRTVPETPAAAPIPTTLPTVSPSVAPPAPEASANPVAAPLPERRPGKSPLSLGFAVLLLCSLVLLLGHRHGINTDAQTVSAAPVGDLGAEADPPVGAAARGGATAVVGFRNLSARPEHEWLSTALTEMISSELALAPRLLSVPGQGVARARSELSLPGSDAPSPEDRRYLQEALGADRIVFGSFLLIDGKDEEQLRIDLWVQAADSGRTLANVAESGPSSELFELVRFMGVRLREALGDPFSEEAGTLRDYLPRSPLAARLYFEGLHELRRFGANRARDLLERSIAAEPDQPLPHLALAEAWAALGYDTRALEAAEEAQRLARNLPRELRLWVEGGFLESSARWGEAIEVYRALWVFAPENLEYGFQLANAQVAGGRPLQALATLGQLRARGGGPQSEARLEMMSALCYESLGERHRALEASDRAIVAASEIGAELVVARTRQIEARSLHALGRFGEAITAIEAAVTAFIGAGDHGAASGARIDLARWQYSRGEMSRAQELASEALEVFVEIGNRSGEADALQLLAMSRAEQGDLFASEADLERALAIQQEMGSGGGIARTLSDLGGLSIRRGRLEQAEAFFHQALEGYRSIDSASGETLLLTNLGILLGLKAENASAIERLQESLDQAEELADQNLISFAQLNLGHARLIGGDLEAAELAFTDARSIWTETENPGWLASALEGLARVAAEKGDPADAMELLEDAMVLQAEIGDSFGLGISRALLAQVLVDISDLSAAEHTARRALEAAAAVSGRQVAAYGALARALLAQGHLAEARRVIEKAEEHLGSKPYEDVYQLQLAITAARVRGAHGDLEVATSALQRIRQRAERGGAWSLAAAASIALGEVELRAGHTDAARTRLLSLRADALARGYLTKADRAFRAAEEGSRQSRAEAPATWWRKRNELAAVSH